MATTYIYTFGIDEKKGFQQEHPELSELLFKGIVQVEKTENDFNEFRATLFSSYGIELAEISRQPYFEPETIL